MVITVDNAPATLELGGTILDVGVGTRGLSKRGDGKLILASTQNQYTGQTRVERGVMEVAGLANGGELSSIGQSSNAAGNLVIGTWGQGATLRHVGDTTSVTDRLFTIGNGADVGGGGVKIESSGTASVQFTNTGAMAHTGNANTNRTLTLGGTNTGNNILAVNVTNNNGTGITSLAKLGEGTWRLTGSNTYSGTTTVGGGTLLVDGSIESSSTVNVGGGSTLGGSGRVSVITGSGTVAPGSSTGILTAQSIDLTSGIDFALEMTAVMPTWSNAFDSGNDILRLTGEMPFVGTANANNTISLYFSGTGEYIGGLFTDLNADFESIFANASFAYYIEDIAGSVSYNEVSYSTLDGDMVTWDVVQIPTADFSDGDVTNGWSMSFNVVPEPATSSFLLWVLALATYSRRKHCLRPTA